MPSTDPSLIRTGRSLHAVGLGVMVLLAVVPYVAAGGGRHSGTTSAGRRIEKSTRLLELEPNVRVRNEQLNRELAVHEQRRREVLERIPEAADEGLFLAQLSELAAKSDLKLQNYRPGPPEKKSTYSQVDIALDADGTYEQLCQFLAGLESLPRYCRLAGLTVSRPEGEASTLKVSLTLRIFFGSTPDQPV